MLIINGTVFYYERTENTRNEHMTEIKEYKSVKL